MKPDTTRIAKFLGVRSDVAPERMEAGDLTQAVNVRLDSTGRASRRDGRTLISSGSTHGLFSDGETTLCVRGGQLQRVNADNSLTALTAVTGSAMSYCAVNGLIYWSDGAATGVVDGGRARSWGLPVPQLPTASVIGGGLPAGAYQYALTYVRADGQESGASVTGLLDLPNGGGISLVAPAASDTDIIRACLYLSTANGSTLYKAALIALGQSGSYQGTGADLAAPLLTQHLSAPPAGSALAWMAGRVWVGLADALFPSAAFSPELFDLREYLPLNGSVTLLAAQPGNTGLFVGTDKGMAYLSGSDPAQMTLIPRSTDPVIPGAMSYVPGHLLGDGEFYGNDIPVWAGTKGLYAGYPDGSVASLTEKRFPLSLAGRGAAYFDRALSQYVLSAA